MAKFIRKLTNDAAALPTILGQAREMFKTKTAQQIQEELGVSRKMVNRALATMKNSSHIASGGLSTTTAEAADAYVRSGRLMAYYSALCITQQEETDIDRQLAMGAEIDRLRAYLSLP